MAEIVYVDIGVDRPITPDEPLPEVPHVPPGSIVIVGGRAPTWRYGMMLHKLHGSAGAVICFYDPKLGGGVIVVSHHPHYREGDVIEYEPPQPEPAPSGA